MGILRKIMPTRTSHQPVKIVADFDLLVNEPIGFKFQGREFIIKPVDTETFLKAAKALQEIQEHLQLQGQGKPLSEDQVYIDYLKFTQVVCPDLTLKDLRKMTLPQIHALVNLIVRHIQGDTTSHLVEGESEEKKNLKI